MVGLDRVLVQTAAGDFLPSTIDKRLKAPITSYLNMRVLSLKRIVFGSGRRVVPATCTLLVALFAMRFTKSEDHLPADICHRRAAWSPGTPSR